MVIRLREKQSNEAVKHSYIIKFHFIRNLAPCLQFLIDHISGQLNRMSIMKIDKVGTPLKKEVQEGTLAKKRKIKRKQ